MISPHDINSEDGYLRPVFPLKDKIRRFCWMITWTLLCKWTPNPLHKWRVFILRLFGGKIGNNNTVYPDCKIWAPWLLQTEDVVTIGPRVEIYNPAGIYLGHHTVLSQDAFLCGATHDYNTPDFTYIKKRITTFPYTWICSKAVVLPGVTCGEGSVLGAASVTARDLDEWMVYSGNPAQLIKERLDFLNNPVTVKQL